MESNEIAWWGVSIGFTRSHRESKRIIGQIVVWSFRKMEAQPWRSLESKNKRNIIWRSIEKGSEIPDSCQADWVQIPIPLLSVCLNLGAKCFPLLSFSH